MDICGMTQISNAIYSKVGYDDVVHIVSVLFAILITVGVCPCGFPFIINMDDLLIIDMGEPY